MIDYVSLLDGQVVSVLKQMATDPNIAGSTPDGEMDPLIYELEKAQARNVLQLGTFLGWSALIIAGVIQRRGGTLVTVDPVQPFLDSCKAKAQAAGLTNIQTVLGRSEDAELAGMLGNDFDAIYIDTTHHYAQTKAEIELYAGRARSGQVLLFHDSSEYARRLDIEGKGGVKAAITEWLAAHDDWTGMIYEAPDYPDAQYGMGVMVKK